MYLVQPITLFTLSSENGGQILSRNTDLSTVINYSGSLSTLTQCFIESFLLLLIRVHSFPISLGHKNSVTWNDNLTYGKISIL